MLDPLGLAFPEYICLRLLSHAPGKSNAELAREANVSPQAMNMVLRGLQERGLVTRPAAVASGRSLPAELTRQGTELLDRTDSGIRARRAAPAGRAHRAGPACDFRRILAELA